MNARRVDQGQRVLCLTCGTFYVSREMFQFGVTGKDEFTICPVCSSLVYEKENPLTGETSACTTT